MSYMKKNINFRLLFLIMVLAVSLAALGIYYNQNYNTLSDKYTQQLDNLQDVTDELLSQKSRLNQTAADLALKQEDESDLNRRFTDLRSENTNLVNQNSNLESELQSRTNELVTKTNDLLAAQSEIIVLKSRVVDLEADVAARDTTISKLNNKVDDICAGQTEKCS